MIDYFVLLIAFGTQTIGIILLLKAERHKLRKLGSPRSFGAVVVLMALSVAAIDMMFAAEALQSLSLSGFGSILIGSTLGGFISTRKSAKSSPDVGATSPHELSTDSASMIPPKKSVGALQFPDRFLQAISACTFQMDEELKCLTWDNACEAIFGCDAEFALQSSLTDLLYGVEPLVSENIIRQASFNGQPRLIMLPAVNNLPARTLQFDIVPDGSVLFVHAKKVSEESAADPRTQNNSIPEFNITNHASALTYVASKEKGLHVTFISSDIKDIFGHGSNGSHITRDLIERRIHPMDREKVLKTYTDAMEQGTPFAIDYRIVEQLENVRWYHEEAMPIAGEAGELHGVIVNLNGRMAAEETMKNTADQALELLSNGIHAGVVFLKDGKIRYTNRAFRALTGFGIEETRGADFTTIVQPADRYMVSQWLEGIDLREGNSERFEFTVACTPSITVEMQLSEVELFGQHFTLGTVRDVTQDLKMEQELTRLATFPDLNPNPIIEVTSDGEISYINQAALETFPSLPLLEAEHPIVQSIQKGLGQFTSAEHQSLYQEATIGDRIYAEQLSSIPATNIIRVYLNDITETRVYEDNLATAKQMAETANRLKSEFLANMSHEIRTPLNIILGYTDLVKEVLHGYENENCEKYFSYIHNAGGQLTQTIDKIIDISRFHISDFPLSPQVLPFSHMVQECVQGFQVLADLGGLTLSSQIKEEDCYIYADPYAVNEAITNVIGNAIKYTLEGSVSVFLERNHAGDIELRVTDTGIGISEEFLPRLFDEFSQEEGGYGRPFEGTGLGLALTKKFIDASGGIISVDSIKGEGTTFYMTFPAYNGIAETSKENVVPMNEPTPTAPTVKTGEQKNILVVEDDTLTQDFMKILLGKKYNKHFAMSASEANAVLESNHINIILMDLSIKGNEDGITLTKAIRNHPDWKDIPIIALTAHAFARDRENAIAAGCNAFFSKPFNRTELLSAIEELAIP